MEKVQLKLSIPTASKEELARGLAAAAEVFQKAGINPKDAAAGEFAREGWDLRGFEDGIEDDDLEAASVWDRAVAAAKDVACAGWPEGRCTGVSLEIVFDPEAQLADRTQALAMLREIAAKRRRWDRDGILARIVVEDLADRDLAKRLVDDLTIAFSTLSMAKYYPDEPIEPKRQAAREAIDALEAP